MPIRLVKQPVIFNRAGVRTVPPVGFPFDFTADELKRITALNPAALAHVVTKDTPKVPEAVIAAPAHVLAAPAAVKTVAEPVATPVVK